MKRSMGLQRAESLTLRSPPQKPGLPKCRPERPQTQGWCYECAQGQLAGEGREAVQMASWSPCGWCGAVARVPAWWEAAVWPRSPDGETRKASLTLLA